MGIHIMLNRSGQEHGYFKIGVWIERHWNHKIKGEKMLYAVHPCDR